MIERVLDTLYPHLFHAAVHLESSLIVYEQAEAALTPLMEALERDYPGVRVFSLPSVGDAHTRRHIELGVKGDPAQVEPAFLAMQAELQSRGAEFRAL